MGLDRSLLVPLREYLPAVASIRSTCSQCTRTDFPRTVYGVLRRTSYSGHGRREINKQRAFMLHTSYFCSRSLRNADRLTGEALTVWRFAGCFAIGTEYAACRSQATWFCLVSVLRSTCAFPSSLVSYGGITNGAASLSVSSSFLNPAM